MSIAVYTHLRSLDAHHTRRRWGLISKIAL